MSLPTAQIKQRAAALAQAAEYESARALYQSLLEQDPYDAEVQHHLALMLMHLGDPAQALEHAREAAALAPHRADVLLNLATLLRLSGCAAEALGYFQQAIQLDPDARDIYPRLAVCYAQLGRHEDAIAANERVLSYQPGHALAHYNKGLSEFALGRIEAALQSYRNALRFKSDLTEAHVSIGHAHRALGQTAEAETAYREALKRAPEAADAALALAELLHTDGQRVTACRELTAFLQHAPDRVTVRCALGRYLIEAGEINAAVTQLRAAVSAGADHPDAHFFLGCALEAKGQPGEAADAFQHTLRLQPRHVGAHVQLANTYLTRGWLNEAVAQYDRALALDDRCIEAYVGKSHPLMYLGRLEESLQACRQALGIQPDHPGALAGIANVYEHNGDHAAAYRAIEPLLAGPEYPTNALLVYANAGKHLGFQADAIARLEAQLNTPALSADERRQLHFALGKLYDQARSYDAAFGHFRRGNDLKSWAFKRNKHRHLTDLLIESFSGDFLRDAARARHTSGRPIFIVGMPRSGTTLTEQILGSHPQVHAAGELTLLNRLVANDLSGIVGSRFRYPRCMPEATVDHLDQLAQAYLGKLEEYDAITPRVTDKLPGNYLHLGLISLLFPEAHIVHCVRHPLDTCLSCYFQDFSGFLAYTFKLEHLGFYYRQYHRLMTHWRQVLPMPILDLRYEDTVADVETAARRLIAFCGLQWDERCLQFHTHERIVRTASYDQVRQPIYQGSAGRWTNYAQHLEPLRALLADLVPDA